MSKVCTSCGCVIENDNAKFCDECGTKFETAAPVKIVPAGVSGSGKLKIGGLGNDSLQKKFDNEKAPNVDIASELQKKEQSQAATLFEDDEDDGPLESGSSIETTKEVRSDAMVDEDESVNYEAEEVVQEDVFIVDNEDDEEVLAPQDDIVIAPRTEKKKLFSFPQKEVSAITMPQSSNLVTNDPYYNDVLPEINNEKVTLQKDIIYKVIAATGAMIIVIILLLYSFG